MKGTKFIFESGCKLTPARLRKFLKAYDEQGVLNLPAAYIVKSIQGVPDGYDKEGKPVTTTIILVGWER
jgi:hypothetical protein